MKSWFLNSIVIPIEKFVSKLHFPYTEMTGIDFLELQNKLKDFDVVFSKNDYMMSNLFIKGKWKHVGLFYQGWVYEATTHGVVKTLLAEWVFKKDHVGVARFNGAITNKASGIQFLFEILLKEIQYDWLMQIGKDKLYCSELVFDFYTLATDGLFDKSFQAESLFGSKMVYPIDLWTSTLFNQVLEY